MTPNMLENYDAFYNMVLSTTIMSNAHGESFAQDATAIINFVGQAYRLSDDFIAGATDIILNKLISLGLTADQQAVYSSREYGSVYTDEDVLFDIKGDVLNTLHTLSQEKNLNINSSWFDYSHYKTYHPHVRFAKINAVGATGNLIAARQVGILKVLGIGCERNYAEAAKRLLFCTLWGDIPSMYCLAYTYSLMEDAKKSKIFYELAELAQKHLLTGCTVVPEEDKALYSEEARNYYVIVSSIKQDVINAYNKTSIDFSFVEAITSDTLDYAKRMDYIDHYDKKQWKDVTNATSRPSKKIGF